MELQPDFERLADCFAGASQELRKLPNVPVINEGQNILAAISTMQEQMVEQYQSLKVSLCSYEMTSIYTDSFKTEIGGLKTQIGGVERRLDSLEGRFDGLQLRLNAE